MKKIVATALLASASLALAGCGTSSGSDASGGSGGSGGGLSVLAAFYPLQYVAQQVGGDAVTVDSLTPPGAEPHDLELSPKQVRSIGDADVVVLLGGLQPSVDEAVAARTPKELVDAAEVPAIKDHLTQHEGLLEEEDAHAGESDDHEAVDPHFWLDPTLLADLAQPVADALAKADPAHADDFASRAAALTASLGELDTDFSTGLASCKQQVFVTSHTAFGYLADRYHLTQIGLSGLDPESEPSPARLREIADQVKAKGVTTIFTEALISPKVADTLASDLGITTAVLDPVESQVDPKVDYRGVMEKNLEALRTALTCS